MSRRRYWWSIEEQRLVEYPPETPVKARVEFIGTGFQYDNMQATDGTDISSRTKHQAYMKRHGVTVADDYKETWAKAEQVRQEKLAGTHEPTNRKLQETIERQIYRVRQGYRPKLPRHED